jgi:hypothetical protein
MEETLNTIGIQTKLLHSKSVFNQEETQEIFGCTHRTLKSFENKKWISPKKFKNRNYYTADDILRCIESQFNLSNNNSWQKMW